MIETDYIVQFTVTVNGQPTGLTGCATKDTTELMLTLQVGDYLTNPLVNADNDYGCEPIQGEWVVSARRIRCFRQTRPPARIYVHIYLTKAKPS